MIISKFFTGTLANTNFRGVVALHIIAGNICQKEEKNTNYRFGAMSPMFKA